MNQMTPSDYSAFICLVATKAVLLLISLKPWQNKRFLRKQMKIDDVSSGVTQP